MKTKLDKYLNKGFEILDSILENTTLSKPGGLPYLLFGSQPSTASLYIKIGRNFEKWFKYIVEENGMTLLPDGIIKDVIRGKSKDIDLLFMDIKNKIIYYRELKSNLELDTEKLPATYEKIKYITEYLHNEYPDFKVDSSLLTWAVYEENDLPSKYNSKIRECNLNNVKVTFPSDLFSLVQVNITKENYYEFFRELGKKIQSI